MVVPLFGWSVGDVVTTIKILYAIGSTFKESTGATKQFTDTASWLESFASDLARITDLVAKYHDPQQPAQWTQNIVDHVKTINAYYTEFEKYLQKFDKALSSKTDLSSKTASNLVQTAAKKVGWTLRELNGKVESLKSGVNEPLLRIHLLFQVQLLYVTVTNMPLSGV